MDDNTKNNNSGTKKKIPVFRRMKDVESKKIEWLWKYRFPKGKLSILAGDPGLGKSQLSLWMAATISNGSNWPMEDNLLMKVMSSSLLLKMMLMIP